MGMSTKISAFLVVDGAARVDRAKKPSLISAIRRRRRFGSRPLAVWVVPPPFSVSHEEAHVQMASGKRTMVPQANEGLSPKRLKGFVSHPQISKALDTNSSPQSKTHVPYQVDYVGESPSTHCSCLTEEDAKKLLETLTRRSISAVWAHYESYIHFSDSTYSIRAKCIYCVKAYYPCDISANGTKDLNTHIEKCREYPPNKKKVDVYGSCYWV